MRIAFVGKYPPIQGGESTKLFWLTQGLAERHHEVLVLSNWRAIEQAENTRPSTPQITGSRVVSLSIDGGKNPNIIPQYNPITEELVSLGLRALPAFKPDLIVGWYLLPYANAAMILSDALRVPFVLQHAGSDIQRLLFNGRYSNYLKYMIRKASGIMAYPSTTDLFRSLTERPIWIHRVGFPDVYGRRELSKTLNHSLAISRPERTILFLGKISKPKGIYRFLGNTNLSALDIDLLVVASGTQFPSFERWLKRNHADNVFVHQAIPPWEVPSLLRSVAAVIVPEGDFGVEAHRSRVPTESLLCGTPVIVSNEIYENYSTKELLLRADFNDAACIERCINLALSPDIRDRVWRGEDLVRSAIPTFESYLCEFEEFASQITAENPSS